jgi:L-ascorbate metabolism protein UlaG (beta-lactamase superfamily)
MRSTRPNWLDKTPPARTWCTPGGEPVGFILEMENGFKIWHMGDTGVFGDMKLIGDMYRPTWC